MASSSREPKVLTVEEAIGQAFGGSTAEANLVSRLLTRATRVDPSPSESVIVLFTGYGKRLAETTQELWSRGPFKRIWIFGPDSCPWKKDPNADAVKYRGWLIASGIEEDRIDADASPETSTTAGQAKVAARRVEEVGDVRDLALVTAAYHQPRAYMTLLKALQDRHLNEQINIYPRPLMPEGDDWESTDMKLLLEISWAAALRTDEALKIFKYQKKGDVVSWPTLRKHLRQIGVD